ncbi:MAG: ABC transporter permease subunit [Lachnospiraceae bacterium]|nr:ABC transporter permease subunit [Lachnospiraceae bacterium]
MRALLAFMKKEWMEQIRSGRLVILTIIFVLLGIMNPAIAKLTPWLLEMMSDTLAESGMIFNSVTVDAMSSWGQFFKNLPMGLIIFILLESSIFTREYQSGTLVLALTKGLERHKVVLAKAMVLTFLWTVYYWSCFAITYGYNEYFWDNAVAKNLLFSVICWWLFGLWAVMLAVFFSTIAKSNISVLAGTGGVAFATYLISLLPKVKRYSPSVLMDGNSLIYGLEDVQAYTVAIIVTVILCVVCLALSIPALNKKRI